MQKDTLPHNWVLLSRWYALALLIILVDQLTKHLANTQLEYARPVEILPILNFTLHFNTGAAFSIFADNGLWGRVILSSMSAFVSVVLLVWVSRIYRSQILLTLALSLVLGGAIGNLWDRAVVGHVVDFISFHWGDYYFATFNIADAAITVGAILMILDMIIHPEAKPEKSAK